jgi:hypothetical protein
LRLRAEQRGYKGLSVTKWLSGELSTGLSRSTCQMVAWSILSEFLLPCALSQARSEPLFGKKEGEIEMLTVFGTIFKVVSHLHTLEVATSWLLRGTKALFHSNVGFLGLSALMSHLGLN